MSVLRRIQLWVKRVLLGEDAYLCDSCRYDHPTACRNSERPNATKCKEFKPR
jgi:hypothetical protein